MKKSNEALLAELLESAEIKRRNRNARRYLCGKKKKSLVEIIFGM